MPITIGNSILLFLMASEGGVSRIDGVVFVLPYLIVDGFIVLVWGADLVVDSAIVFAHVFGVSERVIGITIVACPHVRACRHPRSLGRSGVSRVLRGLSRVPGLPFPAETVQARP